PSSKWSRQNVHAQGQVRSEYCLQQKHPFHKEEPIPKRPLSKSSFFSSPNPFQVFVFEGNDKIILEV
ncbi:MAG: hypothetical protein KIG51_10490, partial [Fibrobacter sp.]|nr:hypothetical protein [Fibrobacter sp.]